jgi:Xaa-Pro aminopeptidase
LRSGRINQVRESLEREGLDALLVSQAGNRQYLSGFTGSDGWLIVSAAKLYLCVDFRYIEQAKRESPQFDIVHVKGTISDWLPPLISDMSPRNVGFDARHISYSTYNQLCGTLNGNKTETVFVPTIDLIESIRTMKEKEEIENISKAAGLADSAFEHVKSIISPGMSEREIAWAIEKYLREQGSETIPFDVIVASGPNAALPHHKPSDRIIQRNEPVLFDFGARVNGYCSDMSRTIIYGEYDDTFQKVYNIVLGAQLTALNTVVIDMTGEEADRIARDIIEQANYGDFFGHSLGHGVGLVEHEKPRLGPDSGDKLLDSMVFTIEPGIYIPGWGGIRIEDTVVMENGRIRTLTNSDKGAII